MLVCVSKVRVSGRCGQVFGDASGVGEVWEVPASGPHGDRRLRQPFEQPGLVVVAEAVAGDDRVRVSAGP